MDMAEKKGVALGEAINLVNLAGYADGAVVSRTVIDKPVGTVTAFSFDAGEGLSEHTAPYDAFVQVLDGEAEVNINGVAHNVAAGEIIIMPANIPHSLRAVKRFKMLLVMIRA
jgi:quercetin dioxygenase-like cupin family protein